MMSLLCKLGVTVITVFVLCEVLWYVLHIDKLRLLQQKDTDANIVFIVKSSSNRCTINVKLGMCRFQYLLMYIYFVHSIL